MVKTKINKHIKIRPVIKYIVNLKNLKYYAFINHTLHLLVMIHGLISLGLN